MIANLIEEINWKFPTELNLRKGLIDQLEVMLLSSHTRTDVQIESLYVPDTNQYLGRGSKSLYSLTFDWRADIK